MYRRAGKLCPSVSAVESCCPAAKGLGHAGAQVREVGDGNINYVYIVEGPTGGLVLKQGLPYLRIAHDWPLTQVLLLPSSPNISFKTIMSFRTSQWSSGQLEQAQGATPPAGWRAIYPSPLPALVHDGVPSTSQRMGGQRSVSRQAGVHL